MSCPACDNTGKVEVAQTLGIITTVECGLDHTPLEKAFIALASAKAARDAAWERLERAYTIPEHEQADADYAAAWDSVRAIGRLIGQLRLQEDRHVDAR